MYNPNRKTAVESRGFFHVSICLQEKDFNTDFLCQSPFPKRQTSRLWWYRGILILFFSICQNEAPQSFPVRHTHNPTYSLHLLLPYFGFCYILHNNLSHQSVLADHVPWPPCFWISPKGSSHPNNHSFHEKRTVTVRYIWSCYML